MVGVAQALRRPAAPGCAAAGSGGGPRVLTAVEPDERVELGEQLLEARRRLGSLGALGRRGTAACGRPAAERRPAPWRRRGPPTDARASTPAAASCALPMTVAVASAEIVSSPSDAAAMASSAMRACVARGRRRVASTQQTTEHGRRAASRTRTPSSAAVSKLGAPACRTRRPTLERAPGEIAAHRGGDRRGLVADARARPAPPASSSAASASSELVVLAPRSPPLRVDGERTGGELLGEEAAVRDQRVGVGPARGVEQVVHLRRRAGRAGRRGR